MSAFHAQLSPTTTLAYQLEFYLWGRGNGLDEDVSSILRNQAGHGGVHAQQHSEAGRGDGYTETDLWGLLSS